MGSDEVDVGECVGYDCLFIKDYKLFARVLFKKPGHLKMEFDKELPCINVFPEDIIHDETEHRIPSFR